MADLSSGRGRKHSEGNLYHITARGVGRQIIFEDDRDKGCFKSLLEAACNERGAEVYAWCFMDNHVHLLLHAPLESISAMMRKLLAGYAKYFNKRHERVGSLFQGRFHSTPLETDEQLLATVSYIHRNPLEMKAGLGYRWSSYREYLEGGGLASISFVLEIFGSLEDFVTYHEGEKASAPHDCYDPFDSKDARVQKALRSVLGDLNPYSVRSLSKAERNDILRQLKEAGLSIREIERATSIGRGIISRA